MNLIKGILWGVVGQIFAFLQLQGSVKFGWNKTYPFIVYGSSIIVTWVFIKSIDNIVQHFEGELWPSRLIGFGIGVIVFTTLSWIMFKEPLTLKTLICIALAACIIGIQVMWK